MDDLIVIILTLVIAAYGAIRQAKKRREAEDLPKQPGESVESSGYQAPNDMFLSHDWSPEPYEEENDVEKEGLLVEQVVEKQYRFAPENEGSPVYKRDLTDSEELKILDNVVNKLPSGFSLREAVIYNEILNRKYE